MYWKAGAETSSPLIARFGPVGVRLTVIIEYNGDGVLASVGTAMRDDECEWAAFLVGACGVDLRPGLTTFATAELGVRTIDELNAAGFTAGR